MKRLMLQLGLERLTLGDVSDVEHYPVDSDISEKVRDESLHIAPAPLGVTHAKLNLLGVADGLCRSCLDAREHALLLVRVHYVDQSTVCEVGLGVSEHPLDRWAHVVDRAILSNDANHVGGVLHERAEARLRASIECLFGQRCA